MAIDPKRVAFQVALRALQLEGTDQAALEAAYTSGTLSTAMDGADMPYSALRDIAIAAEAELAEIIANDIAHPYREALAGRSVDLESGDTVPTVSSTGIEFVGVFTGANDSDDELPLTIGSIQQIWRYMRSVPSRYTTSIRKYKIFNGRLYHTRDEAYLDGCVWDRASALARFSSSDLSPLPVALEATWIARTLELLASEGWLIQEGQYYARIAQDGLAKLRGRNPDLPSLPSQDGATRVAAN